MAAHLITGYAGTEHIQSADDGAFNAAFFGDGQNVMESGNQFEASILDNNTVRVLDGDLLMYGRHVRISPDTYEDLTIATGKAGKNRNDLIVMTYEKNSSDGTEKAYLQVIKGTDSDGTASDPSYTNGNILEGATLNQMPLYRVKIEGVVLQDVVQLFTTIPTYKALAESYAEQFEDEIKSLKDEDILDSMEEIEANTQSNMFAGALAVKELNNNLTSLENNTFGTSVNLLTYGENNKYTFPNDGYIQLNSSTGTIYFKLYDSDDNMLEGAALTAVSGTSQKTLVFVKKGMKGFGARNTSSGIANYIPLV